MISHDWQSDVQKHHLQLQMLAHHLQWSFFNQLFIRVQVIYNVVLAPATQQSESAIHIHTATLFQTPLPYRSLLLLSHFSGARLCATPQTAAHQAPPSLGFSRQEHWSGYIGHYRALNRIPCAIQQVLASYLLYVYCCHCLVDKLCPTLCNPMDCSPPGSSVHGIYQPRILEWVAISFSRGSS